MDDRENKINEKKFIILHAYVRRESSSQHVLKYPQVSLCVLTLVLRTACPAPSALEARKIEAVESSLYLRKI